LLLLICYVSTVNKLDQLSALCRTTLYVYQMRTALTVCLSALFFSGVSASAIPALDHLEIQLEGEAEGWLNATCTFHELGWVSKANATTAIERILLQAGHFLERDEALKAQKAALTRTPECKALWPVSDD